MASSFLRLDAILYLDKCFRNHYEYNCTFASIQESYKEYFRGYGLTLSRSSFHEYLHKFMEMGAEFKGKEKNDGSFTHATVTAVSGHRESIYQYADINAPLPAMREIMGKIRKDSGVQLLSILKEEAENGAADSMNVWLRLFLQRMLSEEKVSLNTVSFYENLELMEENIDTFEKILDAILSKKPIIFNYKYGLNRVVKMHPYRLKNYNQRWYVIGKRYNDNPCEEFPDEYYEPLAIMSINGIETIKETSFSKPKADIKPWNVDYIPMDEEELDDYFYDVVGLTFTPEGPQDIYIRFSPFRYERYVKTKPISATQREVKPGHEYYDSENPTIKLKVHINKELIQQILSFGSDCEVVAPESLRTRLREELQKMLDKNS